MKRPNDKGVPTERAIDLLIDVAARTAYERLDPEDPANAKFMDWLAREARMQLSAAERREIDRQAAVFAERVLARAHAERARNRHHVRCVNEAPSVYSATPSQGSDAASDGQSPAPRWDLAVAAGVGRELWDEPPSGFVALPGDLANGQYVALGVDGDSMAPLLHTGDTILVKLGGDVAPNHIIVARHPERGYVVKRVGRVAPARIELTSLNAEYSPLDLPNDAALVLGTVVLRWCPHDSAEPGL